ncbi:uncharacterized protein C8Q71DRAFT_737193 [Rhodofomes roseus]|uniref:Secreted protein n=1 Tax=Rhodofomes roseus TaxID=34475 RepID=A0ABQ8KTR6_9APHY|nr:uncharacterized protein C8Q71DRAFT_737193 [Rhodofomes roseus]KAH9841481.1 hypothetical protein C8Q71DRAFT_737193 [Rhodofomes roseus]
MPAVMVVAILRSCTLSSLIDRLPRCDDPLGQTMHEPKGTSFATRRCSRGKTSLASSVLTSRFWHQDGVRTISGYVLRCDLRASRAQRQTSVGTCSLRARSCSFTFVLPYMQLADRDPRPAQETVMSFHLRGRPGYSSPRIRLYCSRALIGQVHCGRVQRRSWRPEDAMRQLEEGRV